MSSSFSLDKINPKLLRRIYRACRPTNDEPNLALNLEICDYVNAKKGSAPREAAITVVKLIAQRDPQTSELAISLLDNLVKNCGYPFHLQISRKEFLNELVKRFPERPPMRYTRVQRLILAQIEEWYQTICRTSKYKEDFQYIKDMHRLLTRKGYVFPEVKVEDVAVLNPSDNLKSLEEIQEEEAIVQSAKLQELIRRGRPQDLQEANKLMKIMAGFKDDNLKENKKQLHDDIVRLTRKAEILAEMLASIEAQGGKIDSDSSEAVVELYSSIKSAQPIINKIIEEEGDNEEQVHNLLQLNDDVNNLVNKYQLLKGGKVSEASQIKVGALPEQEMNLIDFDDEPEDVVNATNNEQGFTDLLSDLSNLAFTDNTNSSSNINPLNLYGAGGSISLGNTSSAIPSSSHTPLSQPVPSSNLPKVTPSTSQGNTIDLLGDFGTPSPKLQSNTVQQSNALDPFGLNFPQTTPNPVQTPLGYTKIIPITQSENLKIEVGANQSDANSFRGRILFSNLSAPTISQLKFLIAVPKTCKLDLKPQSSDMILGFNNHGATQDFVIDNPNSKQLKIKWKAEYKVDGNSKEDTGVSVLE
ncbi:GGA2 [[Candida] subhashii]|uniref:GGA2 n=1 Tax=[Candida] subhashii TaxID=561895 RepID=A0A8J5QHM6_9ASCO|nr:GGA2 [[Candida] subhashii]KAG7661312.1 GGA2 [[Candida] subhashii]